MIFAILSIGIERHQFELEGLVGGGSHDVRTDQKRER
jgi:hypothetical protein